MNKLCLQPDWDPEIIIKDLSIDHLIKSQIKIIFLDVDGTLLPRKDTHIHSSIKNWVLEASKYFHLHLLSNNPSKKRIERIANELNLNFTHRASKPRKATILKVLKKYNFDKNNIAILGDRLFTDVFLGNRLGFYTILVKPIGSNGNSSNKNLFQNLEKIISRKIGAYN